MTKYKLAILTSHPIQYQAPLFKKMADNPQLGVVVYFRNRPIEYDREFGRELKWDIPLLEGYSSKFLTNKFLIFNELRHGNFDALLIYGWNSWVNWFTVLSAKVLGVRILMVGENPLNQELLKPKWKIFIKKILFRKILFPWVSAFLYIGEENRRFYKFYGVPDKKLFFAPYAVDNDRFVESGKLLSENRKSLRKELRIKGNDVIILFVGKVIGKKRPLDLLKAYHQLTTNNQQLTTKITLLFVGDGILRPELENYVKIHNLKNVFFLGFKNQTELPEYYTIADIFVLPSGVGETWGLVVNEAMCFGLPIIASDVVGCGPDLVKHSENGYIFPVGDIKALAKYLRDLIYGHSDSFVNSDKFVDSDYGLEKRKKFGKKSFEIVQNYSYEKDVNSILKALTYIYLY